MTPEQITELKRKIVKGDSYERIWCARTSPSEVETFTLAQIIEPFTSGDYGVDGLTLFFTKLKNLGSDVRDKVLGILYSSEGVVNAEGMKMLFETVNKDGKFLDDLNIVAAVNSGDYSKERNFESLVQDVGDLRKSRIDSQGNPKWMAILDELKKYTPRREETDQRRQMTLDALVFDYHRKVGFLEPALVLISEKEMYAGEKDISNTRIPQFIEEFLEMSKHNTFFKSTYSGTLENDRLNEEQHPFENILTHMQECCDKSSGSSKKTAGQNATEIFVKLYKASEEPALSTLPVEFSKALHNADKSKGLKGENLLKIFQKAEKKAKDEVSMPPREPQGAGIEPTEQSWMGKERKRLPPEHGK